MRHPIPIIILSIFFLTGLFACKTSQTDYATKWTNEIKEKIIADANQQFDRMTIDSTNHFLTFYKGATKLKYFILRPKFGSANKNIVSVDTLVSVFYSTDQNFELVRELCPAIERSFEGVKYKGEHLGLAEFRYCDGKIKERGFRFKYDIGVWKEYDINGNIIKETDHGKIDRLEMLKDIKYYR